MTEASNKSQPDPSRPDSDPADSDPADSDPTGAAAQRVDELVEAIGHHDRLYYQLDRAVLADVEYDALFAELCALEEQHPELARPDSPTQRVGGAPVAHLESVPHRQPMLSLANTYNRDEVVEWRDSIADYLKLGGAARAELVFAIEPKLDGVAIELVYEAGRLVRAITRGDGKTGDDVTHIVRTIRGLPLVLDPERAPALLEVRGEVVMTRRAFERLNQGRKAAGEELFINPRNTASGTLKSLDPAVTRKRPLTVIGYGLGQTEGFVADGHWSAMQALAELGLDTGGEHRRRGSLDEVLATYDDLLARRNELPVEIDGSVIKLDDAVLQRRLGVRSRSPRWAIAFKFPAQQGTSILREIQIQVGRTGALTPRAMVDPVHVAGVTISFVSLHNRDEIERLGVSPGDRVIIERAGDVIPHIVGVTEKGAGEPFVMPERCPVCHTPVVEVEGEVVVRCPNPACPGVLRRRIEHYVSRGALDVEGVGEKLIDQLVEADLVRSLADLYELGIDDLAGLERMAATSAQNVLKGLEVSKTRPFARWLFGLGIRHVGEHMAEVIAEHWGSLAALRAAGHDDLIGVAAIGPAVADSVVAWLEDPHEQRDVDRMLAAGVSPVAPNPAVTGGVLGNRSFLFTGTLEHMTRREAREKVKAAGGKLLSSVSKNLDVLVVGLKPGSKLKQARELDIEVLEEQAFLDLLEGS